MISFVFRLVWLFLWHVLLSPFRLWFLLSFGSYFITEAILAFWFKGQNLKKRYNASWALVTGSSSGETEIPPPMHSQIYLDEESDPSPGIGKSIAVKLARQGINVVLVAIDDAFLESTFVELKQMFPNQQFRKVAADLGKDGYLPGIAKQTDDLDIQLVFCNAGYMITGFFHNRTLDELMANLHCNAISAVQLTHHFVKKMVERKLPGCVVFTSSAAAALPSPFSVQYAATKSFISAFGASLSPEIKPLGIDTLVFHPSPVASRFYDKAHKIDALEFFKQFAVSPDDLPDQVFGFSIKFNPQTLNPNLPDQVFASIGRTVWRDVGPTALGFRTIMKIIDYSFLATVITKFAPYMPDFKRQTAIEMAAKKKE